ncbi:hypothetical protein GCM10009864_81840 [Streptomyces lunalinharesii]|uniref:Uncharacterized protein n=1 Tax=Streptomyces lunalinharesii TaxID=333384 RepID=A0ABN3T9B7_9ACTN
MALRGVRPVSPYAHPLHNVRQAGSAQQTTRRVCAHVREESIVEPPPASHVGLGVGSGVAAGVAPGVPAPEGDCTVTAAGPVALVDSEPLWTAPSGSEKSRERFPAPRRLGWPAPCVARTAEGHVDTIGAGAHGVPAATGTWRAVGGSGRTT